jgi:hypothetical protein
MNLVFRTNLSIIVAEHMRQIWVFGIVEASFRPARAYLQIIDNTTKKLYCPSSFEFAVTELIMVLLLGIVSEHSVTYWACS